MRYLIVLISILLFLKSNLLEAQERSIAREWNDMLLFSIKNDFARPTIHARNLFHTSVAMYDIWSLFDPVAEPFLIGKTVNGFNIPYQETTYSVGKDSAIHQATSYACYRILKERFKNSNKMAVIYQAYQDKMDAYGYDVNFTDIDYTNGDARALGNYIGNKILEFGLQDNSNEQNAYKNQYYIPFNLPLVVKNSGNKEIDDLNRWQPLALDVIIDQSGNVIGSGAAPFLSPEWGKVVPFSLDTADLEILPRDGFDWWVYHNPPPPPYINLSTDNNGLDDFYKWNFALVSTWSSHLTPEDTTLWDISPKGIGNLQSYPTNSDEYKTFYDILNGGDNSPGYTINPKTGQPYEPQVVKRGDYTRVLSEFWADGPNSTTPPGHWFEILNYVKDHPQFVRKYNGKGEIMDALEYDVKTYLLLGGTLHDVAVTTWGIKGYYDYVRPISALRGMAELGQSSDPSSLNFHTGGLPLIPGYIEVILPSDPLRGKDGENIGEIKIKAWKGPNYLVNVATDIAYVDWILAKDWWPYQRASFVTPPFAGYISGHSTFSSAAAEIMTYITGDEFFPGGMGEFHAPKDEYLIHEDGPSTDITLQWARYKDASDQCSLSRIWGGIHPPCDDIPGRALGNEIAKDAIYFARKYFYQDKDQDGYYANEDCNDENNTVFPNATELCNGIDDNCNHETDEGIITYTYYLDNDNDGFGDVNSKIDTCAVTAPSGYVTNAEDCSSNDASIHPNATELCNEIDDNCNNVVDEGLTLYAFYKDEDNDGFGIINSKIESCNSTLPSGYSLEIGDCNDVDDKINPTTIEICDDIDNNCNESIDEGLILYTYFTDGDGDGAGNANEVFETCKSLPPLGYSINNADCDDTNNLISPLATEIPDNGIDEDCDGKDLITTSVISYDYLANHLFKNYLGNGQVTINFWNMGGQLIFTQKLSNNKQEVFDIKNYPNGIYIVELIEDGNLQKKFRKLILKY